MNLDEVPKHFQAAYAYLARPILTRMNIKYEMSEVCKVLEIEHHSMLSSVRQVAKSLFSKPQNEEQKKYIELQVITPSQSEGLGGCPLSHIDRSAHQSIEQQAKLSLAQRSRGFRFSFPGQSLITPVSSTVSRV